MDANALRSQLNAMRLAEQSNKLEEIHELANGNLRAAQSSLDKVTQQLVAEKDKSK